jgi:hypothetical protein
MTQLGHTRERSGCLSFNQIANIFERPEGIKNIFGVAPKNVFLVKIACWVNYKLQTSPQGC